MYIEMKKNRAGMPYFYKVCSKKGKVVSRTRLDPYEEWSYSMCDLADKATGRRPDRRKKPECSEFLSNTRGRPPIYPSFFKQMFALIGFNGHGQELKRSQKTFLGIDACRYRYELLPKDLKSAIGSPERLQFLCRRANSMLKSSNRKRIKTTYQACFAKVIQELVLYPSQA